MSATRGAAAMSIPAPPGRYAENGAGKAVQSTFRAPDWTPVASAAATAVAAPTLAYAEFAASGQRRSARGQPSRFARAQSLATRRKLQSRRAGRAARAKIIAARNRRHMVRQSA